MTAWVPSPSTCHSPLMSASACGAGLAFPPLDGAHPISPQEEEGQTVRGEVGPGP